VRCANKFDFKNPIIPFSFSKQSKFFKIMDFNCEHCDEKLSINNAGHLEQIALNPNIKANCIHCKQQTRIIPIVSPPPQVVEEDITQIDTPEGFGWLMVHDENTPKQTFDLRLGINTIGRKKSIPVDVPIETADAYMSKNHCSITVVLRPNQTLAYILKDIGSKNGTYLNGTKLKADDMLYLQDGNTIQIGRTKVIIKTVTRTPAAENAVGGQSFGKTIIA
jgi:hypothetical protein